MSDSHTPSPTTRDRGLVEPAANLIDRLQNDGRVDERRIHCDDKTTQAVLMRVRSPRIHFDDDVVI